MLRPQSGHLLEEDGANVTISVFPQLELVQT